MKLDSMLEVYREFSFQSKDTAASNVNRFQNFNSRGYECCVKCK